MGKTVFFPDISIVRSSPSGNEDRFLWPLSFSQKESGSPSRAVGVAVYYRYFSTRSPNIIIS